MEERLQKIMSHAGLGSRRACEDLILDGRVTVNGRMAQIGQKADPAVDRIVVDGRVISATESPLYIALYKPRNVLSTVEAEPNDFRKTVRDLIPVEGHLYPVGRLDYDSEGLVLMTNDGDLANKLTHPRFGHLKIYRVLVARRPDEDQLSTWRRGVVMEDGYKTAPVDVMLDGTSGKGAWLRIGMREGRKRQIREVGSLIGLPVVRILRIAIGSLRLGTLKSGEWRHLTEEEVAELKGEGAQRAPRPTRGRSQPQRTRPARSQAGDRPGAGRPDTRPDRPVRSQGSDRPEGGRSDSRPGRPERSQGSDRPEGGRSDSRPGRSSRSQGSDRPEGGRSDSRPGRPSRSHGSDRPEGGRSDSRPDRPSRSQGSDRPEGGRSDSRPGRPSRSHGSDRPEGGRSDSRPGRSERSQGSDRPGGGRSDSRPDRPARPSSRPSARKSPDGSSRPTKPKNNSRSRK